MAEGSIGVAAQQDCLTAPGVFRRIKRPVGRREHLRCIRRCIREVPSTTTRPQNAPTPQATGPAFHELAKGTKRSDQEKTR